MESKVDITGQQSRPSKASQLVVEAILRLKQGRGFGQKEILKCIDTNYGLNTKLTKSVVAALKRCVDYGVLDITHGRYSLTPAARKESIILRHGHCQSKCIMRARRRRGGCKKKRRHRHKKRCGSRSRSRSRSRRGRRKCGGRSRRGRSRRGRRRRGRSRRGRSRRGRRRRHGSKCGKKHRRHRKSRGCRTKGRRRRTRRRC